MFDFLNKKEKRTCVCCEKELLEYASKYVGKLCICQKCASLSLSTQNNELNSDFVIADFITQPCYSSQLYSIGEYCYMFQISKNHLKIKLSWEDYGAGGGLGCVYKEKIVEISRDFFCEQIISNVIFMQPYKIITEEQIKIHKAQLQMCFEENDAFKEFALKASFLRH